VQTTALIGQCDDPEGGPEVMALYVSIARFRRAGLDAPAVRKEAQELVQESLTAQAAGGLFTLN